MALETSNYISLNDVTELTSSHLVKSIKDYEERFKWQLARDDKMQFRKTVVRLANHDLKPMADVYHTQAESLLTKLLECSKHKPCRSYICPHCRKKRQTEAQARAVAKFSSYGFDNTRFITILLPAVKDITGYHNTIKAHRKRLTSILSRQTENISLMGAFEIDHKIPNNFWTIGPRTKALYTDLGIDDFTTSWFTPHIHLIAGIPDELSVKELKGSIGQAFYNGNIPPRSIRIEKFRQTLPQSRKQLPPLAISADLDKVLEKTASYIFKARLQYTWMQYEQVNADTRSKRTAYSHRTYEVIPLVSLVNEIDSNGGFKSMKYDYRMSSRVV